MVPTAWQDEALARDGVSREVPGSALKGATVMGQVYGLLILWLLKGEGVGTELGAKTVRQE